MRSRGTGATARRKPSGGVGRRGWTAALVLAALPLLHAGSTVAAQATDGVAVYWVYVANESSDLISRVRFSDGVAVEEKTVEVGYHPTDLDGAHGLIVSPDGAYWYVSIAHGQPYGQVWKMESGSDRLVDSTTVGLFPATLALTPDGAMLYAVNFNLHGDPVPSTVSPVFTPVMHPLEQIETCVRPHGSRVSRDGARHYSGCLLSDQLVEISTDGLSVIRRLRLTQGAEEFVSDEQSAAVLPAEGACRPTWIAVSADDEHLYVPCNGRGEVLEIEASTLTIQRRFPTGNGPYNADVTPDGSHLVVTLKGNQAVAIFDLATGEETRVETSRPVTHGVVVSPDSRYAFVSNEAVGATRGTVDVIDIAARHLVASVEVQYQPGGIGFWKMEPGRF